MLNRSSYYQDFEQMENMMQSELLQTTVRSLETFAREQEQQKEALQETVRSLAAAVTQMLQDAQILPQKTVKAISEAEPPKIKKAEPMSSDDHKEDPYAHVHCVC